MRRSLPFIAALGLLAACSGGGPTTVGGAAVTGGGGAGAANPHTFVNPTDPKTYQATGGVQSYEFSTTPGSQQYNQLYAGDANTARDNGYQITYNPRDGIFDLALKATKAGVDISTRFQDPVHRTAFGGAREPQSGTPDLTAKGVIYFQNGSSSGVFNTDGYTPGDVELAAQRAAAAAFDRIREGIEPSYISVDDLDAAIARTRPSVTSEICQRFGDEADRFARV